MARHPEPEPVVESPSRDYSDRFREDRIIREVVPPFRILERRGESEAIWEKEGQRYTQGEALRFALLWRRKRNREVC